MKYSPKDSLNELLDVPQMRLNDLSDLPVKEVAGAVGAFRASVNAKASYAVPDTEALWFYATNHLVSRVKARFDPDEPLPKWAASVVSKYVDEVLPSQANRLFAYMLLIVTRESRHLGKTASAWPKWYLTMPEEFMAFHAKILGKGSEQAASRLVSEPPDLKLGHYVDLVATVFEKGKWGGGFGGKPWANIARCLHSMVTGKTSMEVMVDTSYALAHNNGPMFNKGMFYKVYTGEFEKILDVQRSGQVPELVSAGLLNQDSTLVPERLRSLVVEYGKSDPGAFGSYVDWHKVEALGAVGSYTVEKKAQDKKNPKLVAPTYVFFGGKKVVSAGEFFVWPGQKVSVVKRVNA